MEKNIIAQVGFLMSVKISEGCSYLLYSKSKLIAFTFLLLGTFAVLVFLLGTHFLSKGHWMGLVAPILLVATPLMRFPLTETWAYAPWQAKPCKYEYHHIE